MKNLNLKKLALSTRILAILTLIMFFVVSASAFAQNGYVPAIFNIVLDASGSVSKKDFETATRIIGEFAAILHLRSMVHTGERSDWLAVNRFGGSRRSDDYTWSPS